VENLTIDRRRIRLLTGTAAMAFVLTSGTAWAGIAYQGDDKSYGVDSGHRVRVCDMESDGYGVHADADDWTGGSYRVDDQDGAGGNCNDTTYMNSGINRHRTVEERPAWYQPDVKGDWSNHG
jgi:hypothetical protein